MNWGDGSTNSSFNVSASGTIPATAHTYTSSGTKTVTLTVKDSMGHTSNSPKFSVTVAAVTITLTAPSAQTAVSGTSKSFTLGSFTQSNATGPFTVTVNWGDGSSNSSFNVSAAGTIPATAHTYTSSGSKTVTVTVKDSKGHTSNSPTFAVTVSATTGSISGEVFDDANGDGKIDDGEFGVGLWTVELYLNSTSDLLKTVTTNVSGDWSFTGLAAGPYIVKVVPETGIASTKPTGGMLTITLTAGENSTGNLFGERASG